MDGSLSGTERDVSVRPFPWHTSEGPAATSRLSMRPKPALKLTATRALLCPGWAHRTWALCGQPWSGAFLGQKSKGRGAGPVKRMRGSRLPGFRPWL